MAPSMLVGSWLGGERRNLVVGTLLACMLADVKDAHGVASVMPLSRASEARPLVQPTLVREGLQKFVTFVLPLSERAWIERPDVSCCSSSPTTSNVQFTKKVKLENVVRVRRNQVHDVAFHGTSRRMPKRSENSPESQITNQYTGRHYDEKDLVEEENAGGDIDIIELSEDDYEIISHAGSIPKRKGKGALAKTIAGSGDRSITDGGNDDLHCMTVVQLKEICRSQKLKLTGKKQELIDRIRGNSQQAQEVVNNAR
ncbi:hypothetical protein GUITHDRAFT_108398 [Guillardia theta CCMP2712]|uniref:SAP domain-containing protein n=1 Tax=Guillardia theta (strain CCMP2712) TaxID=905079 RepID=L1JBM5_GUITC|nr:hypothetical protein GUITHDRAFT_108398 [Guillardia theta CCMP2712]EKX45524.1 hypothetical protein GUITHDRAFT_108398 [Guillardia theta CCMP2712]|eukprot:XP_005832504.1 hypothetical protein GUITHDRAFT_108398 [Guillardia theta CCMP2712]